MKKTNKMFLCLLFVFLLTLGLVPAKVHADVLTEVDDGFWRNHQSECDYLYRTYTVNGDQGYAILWASPVSSRQREVLINGTSIYSNWHYTDSNGETWCAVSTGEMSQGYEKIRGWIKTADCLVNPDYISFREAHEEEFVEYDPAYDNALEGLETVVFWTYPCSGKVKTDHMDAGGLRDGRAFDTCWKDSKGRMWAFVSYCYGVRNSWICLDDPANPELEADESVIPRDAVVYPAADNLPDAKSGVTGLTIAAVLSVVAVTLVLLWFFFVRKRRR